MDAKILVNLKDGLIELQGSEEFVGTQIEWLKDVINRTPIDVPSPAVNTQNNVQAEEATIPANTLATAVPNNSEVNDRYIAIFGVAKDIVDTVIHTEENCFSIITRKIKGGNADKQINYSLLYCLAKEFYRQQEVSFEELRELCRDNACLDSGNFAKYFDNHRDLFIVNGKAGSKNKTVKLTSPGRNKAKELLASLVI
ncbi:MAG TPA: hypothetical protein VHT96_14515 [Clostridia bacterium]|nr:hypothetical protein [Clostridia bacterium]